MIANTLPRVSTQGLFSQCSKPLTEGGSNGRAGAQPRLSKAWSDEDGHAESYLELKDGRDAQKGALTLLRAEEVKWQHWADRYVRAARQCGVTLQTQA